MLKVGLGSLAGYATYDGLYELISANVPGEKPDPWVHGIIIFSASMLIMMILFLLSRVRETRSRVRKIIYFLYYVLLTFISVALGFGFYWKWFNSSQVQAQGEQAAVTRVRSDLEIAESRIKALTGTLAALSAYSEKQAKTEYDVGFTCDNIGRGDGPRRELRAADAQAARNANAYITEGASFISDDIAALKSKLAVRPTKLDERTKFVDELNQDLELMVRRYNAFQSHPELLRIREQALTRLSTRTWDNWKGGTFTCPDQKLEDNLRRTARSIDGLQPLEIREVPKVLGSKATIEAFRRLGVSALDLAGTLLARIHLPAWLWPSGAPEPNPTVHAPAATQAVTTSGAVGLAREDWSALIVAAIVDFCLFIVAMDNRRYRPRVFADAGEARLLAEELRKINPDFNAQELLNNYIFPRFRADYVIIPQGVPSLGPQDPQRPLRAQDRLMALTCTALSGRENGIMRRVFFRFFFRPRRALMGRGRSYLANHREFAVYKLYPNALQEVLSALILYPETNETPVPAPQPDRKSWRRRPSSRGEIGTPSEWREPPVEGRLSVDSSPEQTPANAAPSPASGEADARAGAAPPPRQPRGKPPGA